MWGKCAVEPLGTVAPWDSWQVTDVASRCNTLRTVCMTASAGGAEGMEKSTGKPVHMYYYIWDQWSQFWGNCTFDHPFMVCSRNAPMSPFSGQRPASFLLTRNFRLQPVCNSLCLSQQVSLKSSFAFSPGAMTSVGQWLPVTR